MALMAEPREPEVARFIDSYKYDQEMSSRRNRFGGGTSLPLDSDGYEDKQRQLREERHKDWLQQQDKPKDPVYYRVGTPEEGFRGLGEYEKRRQEMNIVRQKEYNDMLRKQRQMEQQKMEARRHQSPPRPAQPPGLQVDYNAQNDHARAEERRAYQDYMGKYQYPNAPSKPPIDYEENKRVLNEERKREYNELMEKKAKEERYWAMRGRPVTPPGGLNIGNYDRQIKETAAQRKKEYKEMLDQQKNEQLKLRAMDRVAEVSPKYVKYRDEERPLVGSPRDINYYRQEKEAKDKFRRDLKSKPKQDFPPPDENVVAEQAPVKGDSDLRVFLELEKEKAMNKKKYAEELVKQQKEHMYLRARQEPEISVIDRNAQNTNPNYLANKPPPGPGYSRVRDEPKYQTPTYWNEGREAGGPGSYDSGVRSNQSSGIPVAFKTQNKSRPIPKRPRHGQPPYYGEGQGQNDVAKEKLDIIARSPPRSPQRLSVQSPEKLPPRSPEKPMPRSPEKQKPRSPEKPLDPDWLRVPLRDDERIDEVGTPLAFKNESQSRPVPERPAHGQPPYPGEGPQFNDLEGQRPYMEPMERSRSPQNLPPRSPEKPANPNWLRVPLRDDERPEDLGTPLAFKTHSQPGKPLPPSDQQYNGPDYAQEGRRYENGPDGLFERADQAQEKPRSRRSLDVERKYSPSKPEQTMPGMQISPRRTKNTLYKDSEEAEERRRQDEIKHQQQQSSKPSEIVRNPFYSSDDYEKFQREIQRKQAEDYRDFLAKKNTEVRKRDWNYEQNGVLELRGDDAVQSKQRELRAERQRDYNNYMSQVKPSSNRVWPEPDGKGALLVKKGEYENVRRMFDEERKQDYLNAMQKRREQRVLNPSRRHEFVDTASGPYGGLFHGLGEHGNRSEVLNRERQQEYNNMLDQQYGKDRPSGRPNWAKETIPNDRDRGRSPMKNPAAADQYQQMLDEKRREEASRRRYEDPEYQSRLSQGRDRGEAGARYGY